MNLGSIAAVVTFIITLGAFFLAIRTEIQKNTVKFADNILSQEKRHSTHEKRLEHIEDKVHYNECIINNNLNHIRSSIDEIKQNFKEHLAQNH